MTATRYCLEKDTLSVCDVDKNTKECLYVPAGAVVSVLQDGAENEMVEVEWDTKKILMFNIDIRERAHPLTS